MKGNEDRIEGIRQRYREWDKERGRETQKKTAKEKEAENK